MKKIIRQLDQRLDFQSYGIWVIVACALLVAWLLYPRPEQVAKQEGVTDISFWTPPGWALWWVEPAVEEFERMHPEYNVVMGTSTVRDTDSDPTRFLLGVAGGAPPDLSFYGSFSLIEWASRGAFLDLGPLIERDRDKEYGIRMEDYIPSALDELTYKEKIYGIPNTVDTRVLYYNSDSLVRAGCIYGEEDQEVLTGKAQVGEPRPPKTWEETCEKLLHANGKADAGGEVVLSSYVRRMAVNENVLEDADIDLELLGAREGDVVALINGTEIFRGRILEILGAEKFRVDFEREQRPGLESLPATLTGECEVKIFSQDSFVCMLTRYSPETGQMSAAGFVPFYGNSWLYMYGYLNDAHFMSEDGNTCTLDSPEIVTALQWVSDVHDAMGGVKAVNMFQKSAESGTMDPFITGQIALRIDTNGMLGLILAFKPELDFGVCPAPIPEKRMKEGFQSVGWGGGFCYAIPETAKNKEGAWALMKWLLSVEAGEIMDEYQASLAKARGQTFLPYVVPYRKLMTWKLDKYLGADSVIPAKSIRAFHEIIAMLEHSRHRPVTPVGQKLWTEHIRSTETATNHSKTPYESLNYGARQVQTALDRILHPPTGPLVNWKVIAIVYLSIVVLFIAGMIVYQELRSKRLGIKRRQWLEGYICASPWLIGFILLGAGPILFSVIISFCHYDVLNPARFIGFTNYVNLMGTHYDEVVQKEVWNDPLLWKSLINTGFMVVSVPIGIVCGLALALLLDAKVRGLHIYRTIYYLPAIVPAVAGFILWIWIFDPARGMLNQALHFFGISDPPFWLQDPVWAKPSLIIMGLWGVGASMIIWLAGLKDIPESLYEAAAIDGAGRTRRFLSVTLPLLSPYIFFNFVMGMIGVFQIFEAAYVMTNGGPADSTLFYVYKLFNEAFRYLSMGTASAMAWILFAIIMTITLFQLWLSKKWVHYGGE